MFVVLAGTANVGTGRGKPDSSESPGFPFEGKEGIFSGLLVGVIEGTGELVGEGVSVGGLSGVSSRAGLDVSFVSTFGVFVYGRSRVGSLDGGILVTVLVGWIATADAIKVGVGSTNPESLSAKLLTARNAMRTKTEIMINIAIKREVVSFSKSFTVSVISFH